MSAKKKDEQDQRIEETEGSTQDTDSSSSTNED